MFYFSDDVSDVILQSIFKLYDKSITISESQPVIESVMSRSRHRLERRNCVSKGPNYIWHIDEYDQLKQT